MATFTAYESLNMSSELDILETEVGFSDLVYISFDGLSQDWYVGPGDRYAYFALSGDVDDMSGSFAIGFDQIRIHHYLDANIWNLTGDLLDVTGTFSVDASFTYFNLDVSIPGMFHATATVDLINYEVTDLDYSFTGEYASFGPYMLRGNDAVNGSGSNDTLLGYAGADTMKGFAGADNLQGGAGGDKLYGGLGSDKLTGGTSADKFIFDAVLNATTNKDTILDFNHAQGDKIQLDNDIFTKFSGSETTRTLTSANFDVVGGEAQGANDWIVYNKGTGYLYYDTNGSAAGGQTAFAIVGSSTHPTLVAGDFQIIG